MQRDDHIKHRTATVKEKFLGLCQKKIIFNLDSLQLTGPFTIDFCQLKQKQWHNKRLTTNNVPTIFQKQPYTLKSNSYVQPPNIKLKMTKTWD